MRRRQRGKHGGATRSGLSTATGRRVTRASPRSTKRAWRRSQRRSRETIPEDLWLALVEGEQGKFALVQAKDGEILADGDKVLDSIEEVRRALASMEETDWAVYATSGLVDDATVLDTRALRAAAGELVRSGTVLRAAPLAGVTRGKVVQAVLGVVVVGGILAGWSFRDELVLLFVGPPPAVKKAEKKKEQRIATVIDSVALVSGCREGIRRHTPGMPGWKLQRVTCAARFSEKTLVAVRPGLAGRPVLTIRWKMRPGGEETLLRQVAERHLSEWKTGRLDGEVEGLGRGAGSVGGGDAATSDRGSTRNGDAGAPGAAGAGARPAVRFASGEGRTREEEERRSRRDEGAVVADREAPGGNRRLRGDPFVAERQSLGDRGKTSCAGLDAGIGIRCAKEDDPMKSIFSLIAVGFALANQCFAQEAGQDAFAVNAKAHAHAVKTAYFRLEDFIRRRSAAATSWAGDVPSAATGWLDSWTERGVRARYCTDDPAVPGTLVVYLAPEVLMGVGSDHQERACGATAVRRGAADASMVGGGDRARGRRKTGCRVAGMHAQFGAIGKGGARRCRGGSVDGDPERAPPGKPRRSRARRGRTGRRVWQRRSLRGARGEQSPHR